MSAAVTAPAPQPHSAAAEQPNRCAPLLSLVRKLIDYGRQLAASLQQHARPADLAAATRAFATTDIALILARITQGLLHATALEALLQRGTARLDGPAMRVTLPPAPRLPRSAQPPTPPPDEPDPRLLRLPTAEQIAAEVSRRPAGAVIVDICRDLGILPSHPLWLELSPLIVRHGGNLATLFIDINRRLFAFPIPGGIAAAPALAPPPLPPSPGPAATGPP